MKNTKNTSFWKIISHIMIPTLLLAVSFRDNLHAQQEPISTMFWNQYSYFNPAASGLFYKHAGTVTGHDQANSQDWKNRSAFANYSARIKALHGGLGIHYIFNQLIHTNNQKLMLSYSYHIKLGEKTTLAAGVSAGILNMRLNPNVKLPTQMPDPSFPKGKGFIMNSGIILKTNKLNIGISATQVTETPIKRINYTPVRHYFAVADYAFNIGNNFQLKPQAQLISDAIDHTIAGNLMAIYKEKYWIGASYRSTERFAFMGGWDILGKFRIGYAYETPPAHGFIFKASHEVVLGILLK